MCLELSGAGYAPDDIGCWKVMIRRRGAQNAWTPFRKTVVEKEILEGGTMVASKVSYERYEVTASQLFRVSHSYESDTDTREWLDEAERGFIHVYLSPYEMLKDICGYYAEKFNNHIGIQADPETKEGLGTEFYVTVYKCTIPAGTIMCEGDFGGTKAGCAERIIFNYEIENLYEFAEQLNKTLPNYPERVKDGKPVRMFRLFW